MTPVAPGPEDPDIEKNVVFAALLLGIGGT